MCGHVVYLAGTGREALELIAAHEPDVALVDLGLPDMNGRDVARRVRASGQRVRLAALTGQDDSDDRRSALEAGFDEYLTKPVEAVTVLALVER
jgi:DNA-binding response OmpR family regulator